MKFQLIGVNHKTAPVEVRERFAIPESRLPEALKRLAGHPGVDEGIILSTCNRVEVLAQTKNGTVDLRGFLRDYFQMDPADYEPHLYEYRESDAVRHLFRVTSSLDSMVVGEPQILGQVKEAYATARAVGAVHSQLDLLLTRAFAVAKRVRTDTRIGAHTVSVAFTAVRLAEQVFTDLKHASVLLIGAGDTIELAARHLAEKQVRRLIVANRTPETAQELAGRHGGYAIALADLPQHLAEADIVISSTAARQPIVTRAMVEQAMAARKRKPMFMVDIAVPRDIEAGVGELPDVYLYGIDDLRQVIDDNLRSRAAAAHEAEAIIDLQVERYMAWRRALTLKNPAVDMRQHAEVYRDEVLGKARAMLAHGKSPDEALAFLANTLTNKLLHHPSARLREAALSGDLDLLHAAGRLYGLDEEEAGTRGE